ncbi:MAG TPA: DUF134 domain-containing protein [Candidatus Omnitrophota bacterium]|nr:DUF134 domain-containing protein [Candidatus Omnitrophota bacterium]
MPVKNKTTRGRPRKCRCVREEPKVRYFRPRGGPLVSGGEVLLTVDECEALCFADRQGLYQADAAKKMRVSRQTFGNIIRSARRKTAEAILCGKPLRIGGGAYAVLKVETPERRAARK